MDAEEAISLTSVGLPRGIYYEVKRKRYRVRLYIGTNVVYRSYHKSLHGEDGAMAAWTKAVKGRPNFTIPVPLDEQQLTSIEDQIKAMCKGAP